jgi:hypothetical protein
LAALVVGKKKTLGLLLRTFTGDWQVGENTLGK